MSLDQFYTRPKVAEHCLATFHEVMDGLGVDLSRHVYVEPSAGCGYFYGLLPGRRRVGIDLDPVEMEGGDTEGVVKADFLRWKPVMDGPFVVVGNPPFGFRGHIALMFINRAGLFADAVGFVLPQLFESDGKGVARKRVKGLQLVHSERLPGDAFITPRGERKTIHTVFQVWSKVGLDRFVPVLEPTCDSYARVVSLSDGGSPATTRNKALLDRCDVYLPSTCYEGKMRAYPSFEDLPYRRGYGVIVLRSRDRLRAHLAGVDWTQYAFRSTNSALNLRRSVIAQAVMDGGFVDD